MKLKQHLGACLTLVVATPVIAQRPDVLKGQLAHTFREVTAVHELRDGRVLVLDSHDRFLYLADFQSGTVQPIGEQGRGDRQYLWPSRLLTIPGDTILLWDAIEGRLHILSAENGLYSLSRSVPNSTIQRRNGGTFSPVMSDTLGRLYRAEHSSSRIVVVRLDKARSVQDTVLNVPRTRESTSRLFDVSSRWTVDRSGRVAHILAQPYRVDLYEPNGSVVTGAPIPFTPTTVTPAIQKAWLEVLYRPRVVWAALGGGQYGFVDTSEPDAEYGSWPPVLPSRLPNSYIGFAGDGSLVVERLALPGFPSQYDVIGARGELVDRFQLAPNTQIVATGHRDVYLTTRGGDGRLTLQRFSVRSR